MNNEKEFNVDSKPDLMPHVRWLTDRIDEIHAALCPGQVGTWQDRAEQAVKAARKVAAERGETKPPKRSPGRPTNQEKRNHIVSLAIANHTLSMSAIARHVGCSDGLVKAVLREYGTQIAEAHREESRGTRN